MLSNKHSVLKFNAIAFISLSITACGGGGSSGSLPSRAVDNIAPYVTSFFPVGDQRPISDSISVTFSEPVSLIKSNNISITESDPNSQNVRPLALPDTILVLDSTQSNTVLDINFANAGAPAGTFLVDDKIYLVELSGITDIAGNTLLSTCRWYFATNLAVVPTALAATARCDAQVNTTSSNWGELIWDRDNWN